MIAEEPESVITGQKTGGEAVAGGGGGRQQQTETKKPTFRGIESFVPTSAQAKQLKLYHKLNNSAHSLGGHTTTRK